MKTFIKKSKDWRAGSLRFLIRQATQPLPPIGRGVGSSRGPDDDSCWHFTAVFYGERDAKKDTATCVLSSHNQHRGIRVLHLTVFSRPRISQVRASFFYARRNRTAVNLMSLFLASFFFIHETQYILCRSRARFSKKRDTYVSRRICITVAITGARARAGERTRDRFSGGEPN